MGRIAFVFSGQGDQFPGMGQQLYEQYETAAKIFETCEALRPGTIEQCFHGTPEELRVTSNTQPCLFAMELAADSVIREKGTLPDAVAGFSLGEVTAAVSAGMFDVETGFKAVCVRSRLMQASAEKYDTSMAAVVKLSSETVYQLADKYSGIYPVNFNCPGQITVSGLSSQMPDFAADVKAAGGRALLLKVNGAFHSPFMQEAADAFGAELKKIEIRKGTIPLYSNVTAEVYSDDAFELLSKQISSPVQWEKTIRNMTSSGIDTFIEIGPGKSLTNMIKKIDPLVKAYSVTEYLSEVESC